MKSLGLLGLVGMGYALGAPGMVNDMPKGLAVPLAAFHQDVNKAIVDFSGYKASAASVASTAGANTVNGLSQAKSAKDLEQARQQSLEMVQNKAAAVFVIVPRVK